MAIIIGTAANDVLAGTTLADRIEGGDGNDRINAGAGDDEIFGGRGSDILTGDAGNDRIFGEDGNDGVYGGGGNDYIDGGDGDDILLGDGGNDTIIGGLGNDRITGGDGNDIIDGGAGNDTLDGGTGDDLFIWRPGDGSDTIIGGSGNDRLELRLAPGDVTPQVLADLAAYQMWAASQTASTTATTGATFTFASLGLTISVVENVSVTVGGQDVSIRQLLNTAPVADAVAHVAAVEDTTIQGQIAATDAQGDAVSFTVLNGPANGSVTLNPITGAFTYTPAADYSGADTFTVQVSDPFGAKVIQTVNVAVAGVADAPVLSSSDTSVSLERVSTLSGTSGDDVLRGDQYAATATVALDISAAVTDSSETLSIRIDGTPAGATLSAGTLQNDGSWLLQRSDLDGLTITTPTDADVALQVTAISQDDNSSAETSALINITFERGASAPAANSLFARVASVDATADASGDLSDTIIASAGNDIYDGGQDTDTVDYSNAAAAVTVDLAAGTATGIGNHTLISIENVIGSSFGDTITGDDGDNVISGGEGDDIITGAGGNDALYGNGGDDAFVWRMGYGSDDIDGGAGSDRLELRLSAVDVTPGLLADLAAYQSWAAAAAPGESFTFASLGVTITDVETVAVNIDGKDVSIRQLLNTAPEAAADMLVSAFEDTAYRGQIAATDADGDALYFSVLNGPAQGTLALDPATGAFVYTPGKNYSGDDRFVVRVTDPAGASVTQTVNVAVASVADAPILSTGNAVASLARIATLTGTSGNDVLRGDQYASTATVALSIAAALTDLDGSETLAVRIGGVPAGAMLSAGTLQSDGTWLLQPSNLAGLTLTAPTAGNLALQVTAIAQDGSSVAQTTSVLNVTFDRGGSLNDTIIASSGNDVYDGGQGTDTVDYSGAAASVTVDLARGTATGIGNHTLTSIENIIGSNFNDNITGSAGNNVIEAGAGSDRVNGGGGDDVFIAGLGDDRYDGGTGYDVLDYSKSSRAIEVQDGEVSGMGSDRYSNVEKVIGSKFNDTFSGGKSVDTFDGGAGNDWFRGYEGSDIFTGGAGNDTFYWSEKDVVSGKKSQGVDTITDFGAGDKLDLSDITDGFLGVNKLFGVNPTTLVKVTDTAAGSMVSVKVGAAFYDVVLLQNVHDVSTAALLADGQLIA